LEEEEEEEVVVMARQGVLGDGDDGVGDQVGLGVGGQARDVEGSM
jgi:hypothetical protein